MTANVQTTLLTALATVTACYGSAPGKPPRIPLPPVDPAAEIAVHSETTTTIEEVDRTSSTCPQGKGEGDPSCVVTHYQVNEPVTRTVSTARYGATPISYAQLRVLGDGQRDQKLGELDDLSARCRRANIPRYVGIGLVLGGLLTGVIVKGDAGKDLVYGGLIGGAASYTVGYLGFGGRQCVEAAALYRELDVSHEVTWNEVYGADYATEMKKLADDFNARRSPSARR